jgi:hypothetical protein
VIFAWNAVHVKETAHREQFSWTLETDADALRELFRVLSMGQLLHAAALMKVRAVINTTKERQGKDVLDDFIDKTIIIH